MFGMSPAFQAAGATIRTMAPQTMRYVGYVATVTGVSYCSWKFNQTVIDPMVEHVTGKIANGFARYYARHEARDAARWSRIMEQEINRRIAAGELEPRTVRTPSAAARRGRDEPTTAATTPTPTPSSQPTSGEAATL